MQTGTAFWIFGKPIQWYGIVIAAAICLGIYLFYREAKKHELDANDVFDACLWIVPLAIICARIYYVIFEWQQYADNPIRALYIWEGGIAIYGAIIGGIIGLLIYCRTRKKGKLNPLMLMDLVVPSVVLGQAIGRWGNFFNQEAYGFLVTDPAQQFFPFSVYIEADASWHLATFFYESIWCFGIFIFLILYRKKPRQMGNILLWYLFLYGIERAFVEGLRLDSLWLIRDVVRVSQALSILLAAGAGITLLVRYLRRKNHPGEVAPPHTADNTQSALFDATPLPQTKPTVAEQEDDTAHDVQPTLHEQAQEQKSETADPHPDEPKGR